VQAPGLLTCVHIVVDEILQLRRKPRFSPALEDLNAVRAAIDLAFNSQGKIAYDCRLLRQDFRGTFGPGRKSPKLPRKGFVMRLVGRLALLGAFLVSPVSVTGCGSEDDPPPPQPSAGRGGGGGTGASSGRGGTGMGGGGGMAGSSGVGATGGTS
jgi:hypothetical protein